MTPILFLQVGANDPPRAGSATHSREFGFRAPGPEPCAERPLGLLAFLPGDILAAA